MNFKDWFEGQCGKRNRGSILSDDDLQMLISNGVLAENELKYRQIYDAMWKTSLYAWQIKDEDKK